MYNRGSVFFFFQVSVSQLGGSNLLLLHSSFPRIWLLNFGGFTYTIMIKFHINFVGVIIENKKCK